MTSVATIVANRIVPGLLDRYLGWTGYRSQQTGAPLDRRRPYNLYEPVAGDHGAHGVFDERATSWSPQVWASKHRAAIAAAVVAAGAGALALTRRARSRAIRPGR